ncbi:MAG: FtsX-like permease family protein [Bdellovibrionales bacterium]
MKIFDSLGWTLFRHYLLSSRSTALIRIIGWLCIVGVSVAVAAMIIVLSVMNGFDGAIRKRLLSVEPHLTIAAEDTTTLAQRFTELQSLLQDYEKTHQEKISVDPFEMQDVILRTANGLYGGAIAKGMENSNIQFILRESQKIKNEELQSKFSKTDLQAREDGSIEFKGNEAAIGVDLAQTLGLFEGDLLTVVAPESLLLPAGEIPRYDSLLIKTIVRTNIAEIDGGLIYYNRQTGLRRLTRTSGKESGFELRLSHPNSFEDLKNNLVRHGFKVESWHDRNAALFHSLKMEKLAMGLFLALTVLIASFSILTVLVLLVTHKRTEMGILMTLGLSQRRTRNAFTAVGCLVAGFGLFGGFSVGLFVCWLLDTFPIIKLPDIYYDTRIPVVVDPVLLSGLLVASIAIAFLSSWAPAYWSTRASVSELLKPQAQASS